MSCDEFNPSADAPVALVDLGDTLAECTPALQRALADLRSPGEPEFDATQAALDPLLEARRRAVMAAPGFWRDLMPRAAGFELLGLLRTTGFRVHVLTKGPYAAPQAWADKVAWCRQHLPDVPVIVTDDKARVHGDVLVDDWLPYVERWQWQWPSGLAIVPAQPWNAGALPGARCIRDDGTDAESIREALLHCARRRAGRSR